jgi:CBS domain-containing protein
MQLREIMTENVVVVRPDAPIREAAQKMKDRDVGPLPVCDGERLVGMLTDRDIVVKAVAEGCDPESTKVADAMTPDVAYCFEDQDTAEAMRLMERHQIRRLPIVSREKRLVGIVSIGDLARKEDDEMRVAETLREVSEPTGNERR